MSIWLTLATALVLGTAHAFEPDHIAAVTSFVVTRPRPREAFGFGLRWALGHGTTILLVGLAVVILDVALPRTMSSTFDRIAGAALVALGLWTMLSSRRLHAHPHRHADGTVHAHLHTHPADAEPHDVAHHGHPHGHPTHSHSHANGYGVTAIGALHGLAGTAPVVALLPLAGIRSAPVAASYLLAFGVGTALSMGLYAMLAGWLAGQAGRRSTNVARGLVLATGLATTVIGIIWIVV